MSDFVDTNIFLRVIIRDDPIKTIRSSELLAKAERGAIALMTSEAVVLEVVQVLSSPRRYNMERPLLSTVLQTLIENPGLRLDHKSAIVRALNLYAVTHLDFTDCLAIEHAKRAGNGTVYSYDRGIGRVPGVRRLEP
ncbi:MAG: PIN domain-containing protein [Candidatus Binatia bacterium]